MPDPTCIVIRPGETYSGAQGFDYFEGIAAQSAGSRGICMHLLTIPPGAAAVRTCPPMRAPTSRAWRSWPAPTRRSRRAS